MLLYDLPDDVLTSVCIPTRTVVGEVSIDYDIYSNHITITNNGILTTNCRSKLRKYVSLQLLPNKDYEIGRTWDGINWDHGPLQFPMTERVILEFVTACEWGASYYKHQKQIFEKVINLVNTFSSNISVEYDIFNDKYNIILTEEKQVNFRRISKKFWLKQQKQNTIF